MPDLLQSITDTVFDIQQADYNSFARPLKKLARLLKSVELSELNAQLKNGLDYEAFIASAEAHTGIGVGELDWPEETDRFLGMALLMIEALAADPDHALSFCSHFFGGSSSKIVSGIQGFTRQVLVPFNRDYKIAVLSQGDDQLRIVRPPSNKVFIVHGHDDAARQGLARFIERLDLEAIILDEQPNQGRTIIDKFEQFAKEVGFAVILLTPDDVIGEPGGEERRARQNVLYELGYFTGSIGRDKVCLLRKGDVQIPTDLSGVLYTDLDVAGAWKLKLGRELKAAGLDVDMNRCC